MPYTPSIEPKRDRWGRYLLPDPVTGKEQPWTRVTTFASTVADTDGLTRWQMRMLAKGLAVRQDLYAMVCATPLEERATLDRVCEQAKEAAAASSGANVGTALHTFTERLDRGEDLAIPDLWNSEVRAYQNTMRAAGLQVSRNYIERIVIIPEFGVAGTFDRLLADRDGTLYIGDLKTGRDLSYSWGEIAIQLALYAHGTRLWLEDHDRYVYMPKVNQDRAIVMHLPAGQARCDLYWVDIDAGWHMANICHTVRKWRSRKDLAVPHTKDPMGKLRQRQPAQATR